MAKSLTDYIFRYMGSRFLDHESKKAFGLIQRDEAPAAKTEVPGPGQSQKQPRLKAVPKAMSPNGGYSISHQADALSCSGLRLDHDSQRSLLQMYQLRCDERLFVNFPEHPSGVGAGTGAAESHCAAPPFQVLLKQLAAGRSLSR